MLCEKSVSQQEVRGLWELIRRMNNEEALGVDPEDKK